MYAITLRPQWAYAVARLGKDIENRTWPLPARMHGQRIAIHAAATPPNRAELHDYVRRTQFATVNNDWKWHEHSIDQVRGAIVATAVVWPLAPQSAMPEEIYWTIGGSPWTIPEFAYQWALADVHALAVPVPCRGAQGFWRVPGGQVQGHRLPGPDLCAGDPPPRPRTSTGRSSRCPLRWIHTNIDCSCPRTHQTV